MSIPIIPENKGVMPIAQRRGFAAMSREKIEIISKKGGLARAAQAGHEGMSQLGRKGGIARAAQLGPEGYRQMGKLGGSHSKTKIVETENS